MIHLKHMGGWSVFVPVSLTRSRSLHFPRISCILFSLNCPIFRLIFKICFVPFGCLLPPSVSLMADACSPAWEGRGEGDGGGGEVVTWMALVV